MYSFGSLRRLDEEIDPLAYKSPFAGNDPLGHLSLDRPGGGAPAMQSSGPGLTMQPGYGVDPGLAMQTPMAPANPDFMGGGQGLSIRPAADIAARPDGMGLKGPMDAPASAMGGGMNAMAAMGMANKMANSMANEEARAPAAQAGKGLGIYDPTYTYDFWSRVGDPLAEMAANKKRRTRRA